MSVDRQLGHLPTPLIVIAGPTAVGKTALAVHIGRALESEVVSADSRQIYRHMDIGTAKPTPAERAAIPHHLIDIVDPDQTLTMAEYQQLAYAVIRDIHSRQKLPLLVGGTGQYITAVIEGWNAPEVSPNPRLRAELEAYAAAHGAMALFERLRILDPLAGERMDPYNVRRTVRALEVCLETGKPFSAQRRKNPPPYRVLQLGLTLERTLLYERVDRRIDAMMEIGLLQEVRNLQARGYDWSLPSMSGLGYAQLGRYLRGEMALEDAVAAVKADTRTFVRRQYTWFRKYTQLQWLEAPDADEVIDHIRQWLTGQFELQQDEET